MNAPATAARLTRAQLKALKPHVITLTDGRLDRESTPDPANETDFATVEADLDAIFDTHLPAFIRARGGATVPIVLYAHGGLVDVESGFATAQKQVDWWNDHGVYPIHFVWKTGAATAIWDAIGRFLSGGSRGPLGDVKDWLIEKGARALGGEQVWLDMKLDAAAASDPVGGARAFAKRLGAWMADNPDAVTVHAVGHSAGSIFHSHLIPVALASGIPRFSTVSFLAPAVRMDTFKTKLLPLADRIDDLAVFTMTEQAELDDTCFTVYGKSLLYLVSASFEKTPGTPILGLQRDVRRDAEVSALLAGPRGDLILSPNGAPPPDGSTAISHGDFDDDAPTMESVALRVTGRAKVVRPFPSGARRGELWADRGASPDVPRGGAGRALCIGIDAYPRDALHGCVNDSRLWASVLGDAGFAVTSLTDGDATRTGILGAIYQLVSTADAGDELVVQYAGHGTHAPDLDGDEDDGQDEALCPVDFREGQLILDDDLARLWDLLPDGAALTIFSDSCHSGGGNRNGDGPVDTLPRSIQLTSAEADRFRVARGARPPKGRAKALEMVEESESPVPEDGEERAPAPPREVHFAACTATQLAWETNGQGDFTGFVAPLLAANIGTVTNREFADLITAGFDAHRQNPTFTAEDGPGGAPLLSAVLASDRPAQESAEPVPTRAVGRDAAIAAILRGLADLIEG